MLIYSISVSIDGFINDRDGSIGWSVPDDDQFACHLEQVRGVGVQLMGRRLYETMLPWETDPSLRDNEATDAFADVWSAIPKVVFSRTLDRVEGNARLARAPLADEIAAAGAATDKHVAVGGAGLAGAAVELGLVDELHLFRCPVVLGGGTSALPPIPAAMVFDRVATRTFAGRVVHEHYRRSPQTSVGAGL